MKRYVKYFLIFILFNPVISLSNPKLCSDVFEFIKGFFADSVNLSSYKGQEGYLRFAEEKLSSLKNMSTVFQYVSRVLSKEEMKTLGWQAYQGGIESFREESSRILDKKGQLKEEIRV